MGEVFLRGTNEPQRQQYTESFDPEQGWVKTWNWKGMSVKKVRQFASQYQAAGCSTRMTMLNDDIAELEVRDTTGEITIDRWEIDAEQVSRSSLVNPIGRGNGVTQDDVNIIGLMGSGLSLQDAKDRITEDTGIAPAWSDSARSNRLLFRMQNNETDYEVDLFTLVHTTNVSNRYQQNIADYGKSMLYTNAQLLSEVTNAGLWIYPLPGRLYSKIQNIYNTAIYWNPQAVDSPYSWRWLKSASTERSVANNRIDITTIYKFDLYINDEYLAY